MLHLGMVQNEARVDLWTIIKAPDGVVGETSRVRPLPSGFQGMQGYLAASFRGRLSNVFLGTTFPKP